MEKHTYKLLEEIEEQLDITNGNYGSKEEYCIFCKSTTYNGHNGIEHDYYCILNMVRQKLKSCGTKNGVREEQPKHLINLDKNNNFLNL